MTFSVITTWIFEILSKVVLVITPTERWQAARRFGEGTSEFNWIPIIGIIVIIILTFLLLLISFTRMQRQKGLAENRVFLDRAQNRGLTDREQELLLDIIRRAGLQRKESIFVLGSAFDRGAERLIKREMANMEDPEQIDLIKQELSLLREKLGFRKRKQSALGTQLKLKNISTRQIPIGKKLYVTRRKQRHVDQIEATVVENTDIEFVIKLAKPMRVMFGELWRVRYYFGAKVWEFDTTVISYDSGKLSLNHTEDVRFINRRRFLRVSVRNMAFLAKFPFNNQFASADETVKSAFDQWLNYDQISGADSVPLRFVPGTVTELAGPGIRIEADLNTEIDDRLMVIFKLDVEELDGTITSTIIQDIGEVRHVRAIEQGHSIAVELVGLSDSDLGVLIRATNAVSVKEKGNAVETEDSDEEKSVAETVSVEGQ